MHMGKVTRSCQIIYFVVPKVTKPTKYQNKSSFLSLDSNILNQYAICQTKSKMQNP